MAALEKVLPSMREWLDLKRPKLHRVSVRVLLTMRVPELEIVSILETGFSGEKFTCLKPSESAT